MGNPCLLLHHGKLESRIEVNPSAFRRRLANTTAAAAAQKLEIALPNIRFFYRDRFDLTLGYAIRGEGVFLDAGLGDADLMRTVIHEVRHLWQFEQPDWPRRTGQHWERDARLYEISWPR